MKIGAPARAESINDDETINSGPRMLGILKTSPVGFKPIETAPKDGTFIRLKPRFAWARETVGCWVAHAEMKAGGAWFDTEGYYVTPYPRYWAPQNGSFQ
jgi:hypothetical protein